MAAVVRGRRSGMLVGVVDRRWSLLEGAKGRLLGAFAGDGVRRIEYVAGFPRSGWIAVWLCPDTDDQRDALAATPAAPSTSGVVRQVVVEAAVATKVREVLLQAGFGGDELAGLVVVAQSQETVDRDYEGSWFYALR